MASGGTVRLAAGDLLGIGEYTIAVEIERIESPEPRPLPERRLGPSALDDPFAADEAPFGAPGRAVPPPPLLDKPDAVDPLELLGGGPSVIPRMPAPGAIHDHLPAEQAHFQPPRAVVEAIPDDWDESGVKPPPPSFPPRTAPTAPVPTSSVPEDWDVTGASKIPPSAPAHSAPPPPSRPPEAPRRPDAEERPVPRSAAPPSSGSSVQAFAAAAGLSADKSGERLPDELMRDAGQMLREVVAGLMELLAARASFKSEFRIEATVIRPVENNPLKFSADPQEALEHLLVPSGKAYLEPARAVREAIQDVKDHKVAMLAAMRTALESLLQRFRPDGLEAQFNQRGKKSSLIGLSGKGRYWDMYRELFAELEQDPESLFRDVFGDEFVRAYEAQIQLLSKSRR